MLGQTNTEDIFNAAFNELYQTRVAESKKHLASLRRTTAACNDICDTHENKHITLYEPQYIIRPILFLSIHVPLFDAMSNFILSWQEAVNANRFPSGLSDRERCVFGTQPGETIIDSAFHLIKIIEYVPHPRLWDSLALILSTTPQSRWIYHHSALTQIVTKLICKVMPQLILPSNTVPIYSAVYMMVKEAGKYITWAQEKYGLAALPTAGKSCASP
jgi:hypothetical protein